MTTTCLLRGQMLPRWCWGLLMALMLVLAGCSDDPTPAPSVTTQPAAPAAVTDGGSASFSVVAEGGNLRYQWQRNRVDVAGANEARYTLAPVTYADNGSRWRAVITNDGGSTASEEVTLTVLPVAPAITTAPVAANANEGGSASFSVAATGSAPLAYQWQRNGSDIVGATAANYALPAVGLADNGARFTVRVSNDAGSVTSAAALLNVAPTVVAPVIGTQPAAQSVTAGQAASFSVAATGSAPLAYQWQRNGSNINGANAASYTTPATGSADNGAQYRVVVSNAAGSVTSSAATLTVQAVAAGPHGALTLSGAGASGAGVGGSFAPTTAFVAGTFGPTCRLTPAGTVCNTSLSVQWNRGSDAFLTIGLGSTDRPSPGATPGQDVNGILIVLTLDASQPNPTRINYYCNFGTNAPGCNFAALGITVDAASRTLRFSNTPVPLASGGGVVTFDGTLNW